MTHVVEEHVLNGAVNVPTISIQLCAPGTTHCQTIDDILVDTGSIGMRVLWTVIDPAYYSTVDSSNNSYTLCLANSRRLEKD